MALFEKKSVFRKFIDSITMAVYDNPELGPEFLDQLEEALVMADVGIETSSKIIEELNKAINYKYITREREIKKELSRIIEEIMDKGGIYFGENAIFRKAFEKTPDEEATLKLFKECKQELENMENTCDIELTQDEINELIKIGIDVKFKEINKSK